MRRYPDPDFDIGGKALLKRYNSVPAPDLDLEISGGGPQFGLKIKRGGGGRTSYPSPSPGSATIF